MPTPYPSVALSRESKIQVRDGRFQNISASGEFKAATYFSSATHVLTLLHELISSTDANTLETFFDANLTTGDVSVVFIDGHTYEGHLISIMKSMHVAGLFVVEMQFIGKQQ